MHTGLRSKRIRQNFTKGSGFATENNYFIKIILSFPEDLWFFIQTVVDCDFTVSHENFHFSFCHFFIFPRNFNYIAQNWSAKSQRNFGPRWTGWVQLAQFVKNVQLFYFELKTIMWKLLDEFCNHNLLNSGNYKKYY